MTADVHGAADFYGTARGAVTARVLRDRLLLLWPDLDRLSVLGIGYPAPYLRLWREHAARCIALTPAQSGASKWPPGARNLSCTAEEDALPFADLTFDRILVVHGLEIAENARRMLREIWRVLKDDGQLLVIAPNRRGMWAYVESTPFGHGQPYSPGQVGSLLAGSFFKVDRRDMALYFPPTSVRLALRSARLVERIGQRYLPGLAGVTITEAVKEVYTPAPLRPVPQRRVVLADAA